MENKGYLDIHTHILPGIDDGAKDWDMTRQMLQKEYEQGVRIILATPHNYPGEEKQENAHVRELCEQAQKIAETIGSDFQVLPGNEVFYREGVVREIKQEHILTLADSRYVLLEYHPRSRKSEIINGIRELTENGYFPVLAHVERVEALMEDEDLRRRVLESGAYMQVNTHSLLGGYFDRRSKKLRKLIEKGQIHFLGSDCHNLGPRPPMMGDAVEKLRKSISSEMIGRITNENTMKFLEKEYI